MGFNYSILPIALWNRAYSYQVYETVLDLCMTNPICVGKVEHAELSLLAAGLVGVT